MGWCILVAVEPLTESMSFVGSPCFASGGALAGAACHYVAVFREVAAA